MLFRSKREPEAMLCDLTMTLRNGQRHDVRVEPHRGHPRNPMPDAEIEEKFQEIQEQFPEWTPDSHQVLDGIYKF